MGPLISIWLQPRETVRSAATANLTVLKIAIIWAWGCAYAFERAMGEARLPDSSFEARLIFPLVVGLFGGAFYFFMMALAINVTNPWFNGRASMREIRQALILGAIPRAVSVVFFLLLALVFREAFFDNPDLPDGYPTTDCIFYWGGLLLILALTVWSIIATSHALAEAQGFHSAWKAWLHLVVAFLTVLLVFAIPMVAWMLLRGPQ